MIHRRTNAFAQARRVFLSAGLVAVFCVSFAHADWLVTTDGAKIETKGSWEVRGRLIVFTRADGRLASMRASEVDLDASAVATTEAIAASEAPPPPPPPPAKKVEPKHVITNADIGRGRPPAVVTGVGGESSEEGDSKAPPPPPTALSVADWSLEYPSEFNGLLVVGTLTNTGDKYIGRIQLGVKVLDSDGATELASGNAFLGLKALPPGESTTFRLPVEGVTLAPKVEFTLRGTELLLEIKGGSKEGDEDSDS